MDIRAATASDIPAIMQLERLDGNAPLVGRWEAQQHAMEIALPSNRYFVALEADTIVAFCILQGIGSANQCIEVRRIIAKSPGRGVGSRFLQAILQICFDELSAHRIELIVHIANERARRVYERIGFVEEGILRDYHRSADGSFRSMRLMSLIRQVQ